jgi:transposase
MKFVVTKTADQLDLQALHRVRERLVSQRTGIINQIRAFLLERGIAVRQGQRFLRVELPRILATPPDVLSPRMVRVIEGLASDWHRLDERIEGLSSEIEELAKRDAGCERLMSIPGIGPIISSAMVAAIGTGDSFSKGRDFAAWLGLVPRQTELEALLAVQIAATGFASLKFLQLGQRHLEDAYIEVYGGYGTRLLRLQLDLIQALDKHRRGRRGNKQTVEVRHVHIHPGGQGVVGISIR